MKIKQLLLWTVGVAALGSFGCQKTPSTSGLQNEFLVYTAYDDDAHFAAIDTYYIPDSILLIGSHAVDSEGNKVSKYWTDNQALALINTIVSEMNSCGYVRLTDDDAKTSADVGLQVSYVEESSYFLGYNNPYWWLDYPYYWAPGYWGPWGGWYYPYVVYYGYTTGSLLIEMVDLTAAASAEGKKLPVIWNSFISGLLRGGGSIDINKAAEGIEQAFEQSQYLNN